MDVEAIPHLYVGQHPADPGNFTVGQAEIPEMSMEEESFSSRVFQSALIVDKYYTPLLCLFGTLGNSLSLLVFYMDAKYRSQSAPYYLSALAVSDTGYLLNLFLVWLEGIYGGGVITSNVACPLVMYLGQVTCFLSVYLIVAFSVERYVAVHYPFSRPRLCTRSKAKKVIGVLTLVSLATFSYVWGIAQVIELDPDHYQQMSGIPFTENLTEFQQTVHFSSYNEQFKEADETGPRRANNTLLDSKSPQLVSRNLRELEKPSLAQEMLKQVPAKDEMLPPWEFDLPEKYSASGASSSPSEEDYDHHHFPILRCSVPEKYYQISEIANYLDSVVTLVIPFLLITFLNMRIAICVWKLKNQREEIMVMGAPNKPGIVPGGRNVVDNYADEMLELEEDTSTSSSTHGKRCLCINRYHHHHSYHPSQRSISGNARRGTQVLYLDPKRKESGSNTNGLKFQKRGVRFEEEHEEQQQSLLLPSNVTPSPSPSRSNRLKLSIIREKGSGPGSHHTHHRHHHRRHHYSSSSSEVRVTKTLLLISCMFLMLNLPAHVLRCAQFIQSLTGTSGGKDFLIAALPWTNILFNTNFAVNFLLYCASGRNFRKSLLNIVFKLFGRRRNNNSAQSPPQRSHTSFLARMRRKRADSAGFPTATIRLSTSVPNGDCDGDLSSSVGNMIQEDEDIQLESMSMSTTGAAQVYSTYIGDNAMSVSV